MPWPAIAKRRWMPAVTITTPSRWISNGCSRRSKICWRVARQHHSRRNQPACRMSDAVTAATSSERLEHALAAFLRQQMSAPVVTMIGFLDIISEDARRFNLDQAIPDLDRMRIASAELSTLVNRVIDAPESIRNKNEEFGAFHSRLRHDLRTPLNAIKGYGEILIEDMQE